MADAKKGGSKKDSKKPAPPAPSPHRVPILIIIWVVIICFFVSFISSRLGFASVYDFGNAILLFVANIIEPLSFISVFISLILLMAIIYTSFLMGELKKEIKAKLESGRESSKETSGGPADVAIPAGHENEKWVKIKNHIESGNPNDWRLAIIEADILLEEMLEKMGYQGNGIGEMLKTVEKSDFHTLDDAWEAHKVRNNIAHQGSDFSLSSAEAKRAIDMYQRVFEEFFYI